MFAKFQPSSAFFAKMADFLGFFKNGALSAWRPPSSKFWALNSNLRSFLCFQHFSHFWPFSTHGLLYLYGRIWWCKLEAAKRLKVTSYRILSIVLGWGAFRILWAHTFAPPSKVSYPCIKHKKSDFLGTGLFLTLQLNVEDLYRLNY